MKTSIFRHQTTLLMTNIIFSRNFNVILGEKSLRAFIQTAKVLKVSVDEL